MSQTRVYRKQKAKKERSLRVQTKWRAWSFTAAIMDRKRQGRNSAFKRMMSVQKKKGRKEEQETRHDQL